MSPLPVKIERLQQKIADERKKLQAAIVQGFPQQRLEDSLAAMYRALAAAKQPRSG